MGDRSGSAWANVPWFDIDVPEMQALGRRPRLESQIEAGARGGLLMVCAPRGFGKTLSLSQWASGRKVRPGWLTLRRSTAQSAAQVMGAAAQALTSAYSELSASEPRLAGITAHSEEIAEMLGRAIAQTGQEATLVVDNSHLINPQIIESLLRARIRSAGNLRIVFAGSEPLRALLNDLLLTGECSELGVRELAYTADEVSSQFDAVDLHVTEAQVSAVFECTAGWPALVQMVRNQVARKGTFLEVGCKELVFGAGVGGAGSGVGAGSESSEIGHEVQHKIERYIHEVMLDDLDQDLAAFAKQATITSRTSPRLAMALTGNKDAPAHLETLYELGLFSGRTVSAKYGVVYTWHDMFADACRRRMQSRDPEALALLHKRAAVELSAGFPVEAINHAIAAQDFDLARLLLRDTWLPRLINGQAEGLLREAALVQGSLPPSPELLLIQACCLNIQEDTLGAQLLRSQAHALLAEPSGGSLELPAETQLTMGLAELFLLDDADNLERATYATEQLLIRTSPSTAVLAHSLFVLGWTTLRLRTNPAQAVKFLESAQSIASTGQFPHLEQRIQENLFFARCFLGDFPETIPPGLEREVPSQHGLEPWLKGTGGIDAQSGHSGVQGGNTKALHSSSWRSYDGGITAVALGSMYYWQGSFTTALELLSRTKWASDDGDVSGYVGLGIVYEGLAAAVTKDPASMTRALSRLEALPSQEIHGVPWPVYRALVDGALAEASGNHRAAQMSLRLVLEAKNIPVCRVLAADMLRRMGRPDDAVRFLRGLDRKRMPRYALVSAHVTSAAILWGRGDTVKAHQHLERGLLAAAPANIQRPFVVQDEVLHSLLNQHAIWGSKHEEFLALLLSKNTDSHKGSPMNGTALSDREAEILGLLRTTKTAEEIAASLHISVNTVRTHQRAIYRKLGVGSRREAIRLFAAHA